MKFLSSHSNCYPIHFSLEDGFCRQQPTYNFHFLLSKIFPFLSDQSESVFRLSSLLIGWLCCSSWFPKVAREALCVKGGQLVLHFMLSKDNRRNQPVLVWSNSCTVCRPITYQVTTPANGDRQLDIRRRIVSAIAVFQQERCELVTVFRIRSDPLFLGFPDPDPLTNFRDPITVPDPSYS